MYIQRILFGCPGTGKSYQVENEIIKRQLKIQEAGDNVIKTVFHPEYSYGDFMGKLLPISRNSTIEYNYYPGHFLQTLAQAYKNILALPIEFNHSQANNVALVIDEINRGNSSAIFGGIFQLLDRENDGWSSYAINLSDMEFEWLIQKLEIVSEEKTYNNKLTYVNYLFNGEKLSNTILHFLSHKKIKLPPNLSIICTMNTSDESIYYMDSAFKRRWEWQFIDVDFGLFPEKSILIEGNGYTVENWAILVQELNAFIKQNHQVIRNIEDKQIGYWFIKPQNGVIPIKDIQNKLMFFLWDNVFARNKQPLSELLELDKNSLITFGDFQKQVDKFIEKICPSCHKQEQTLSDYSEIPAFLRKPVNSDYQR